VTLSQLSFGFQAGGQAYSEFIFFEDATALGDFKRGNYELGAQASAVAVTAGASVDAEFNGGMAIFTQAKGGLMYEASVGGQKFKVEANE
jgi:lipid-binding SYLF domain-containing protein